MNKNYTFLIIAIALILVLGGAYYVMSRPKTALAPKAPIINNPQPDTQISTQPPTQPPATQKLLPE